MCPGNLRMLCTQKATYTHIHRKPPVDKPKTVVQTFHTRMRKTAPTMPRVSLGCVFRIRCDCRVFCVLLLVL